jgi:hypothetical protein
MMAKPALFHVRNLWPVHDRLMVFMPADDGQRVVADPDGGFGPRAVSDQVE